MDSMSAGRHSQAAVDRDIIDPLAGLTLSEFSTDCRRRWCGALCRGPYSLPCRGLSDDLEKAIMVRAPLGPLGLILVLLIVSACAPAPDPVAAPPGAALQETALQSPARPSATDVPATISRPAPLEVVRVSLASDTAVYAPHFIALEKGYYADEGIDLEIIRAGGGVATPALIAGELQYSTSVATSLSAILQGAPLKIVYVHADRPGYELWSSSPDVRTLDDLSGKLIGVQSRGDTMELSARMVLLQHGIDGGAASYAALGVGGSRVAALQAGAVAAAVLDGSEVANVHEILPQGKLLANIRDDVRMLHTGVTASDAELQQHGDRVHRFLRATIKGREYFKAFKDESIHILMKYSADAESAIQFDYDSVLPALTQDGTLPVDVQQRDAALRASLNGIDRVPDSRQMYDYAITNDVYRELRAANWKPTR
jgi:ABC-type nitrate/sulfonate/bicarbonate transport system substrate-binding protein